MKATRTHTFEPGDVFETPSGQMLVVLPYDYKHNEFVFGGRDRHPLNLYSDAPKTREETQDKLRWARAKKTGRLEISLKSAQ